MRQGVEIGMNGDILFDVRNNVGYITLNRPAKLNALSYPVIKILYEKLLEWKKDDNVALLVIRGAGEKAFCAGGDVRHLYDKRNEDVVEYGFGFFYTEYCMNLTMHTYPKPILAYMNGIVMGGGVGVGVAATHRIVTEKTKWSMPEMNIGLYPDVGGSYFLNKMPTYMGRYLALTSCIIRGADVLYTEGADYYMESSKWDDLIYEIENGKWEIDSAKDTLDNILESLLKNKPEGCELEKIEDKIKRHFDFESMEEIVESLKSDSDKWAKATLENILSKSPTSLKVTLKQLVDGSKKNLSECFEMELDMSMNFLTCHDFFEGVRSVLVDKDRNPTWNPSSLEEIDKDYVDKFFSYEWENNKNPLKDFLSRQLV
ncbi:enoyl-CoA hydratase/isomerase family protein [Anaeromicrobium sediminis]|uniref:3-hydroxyisobutyryl-CoA hydrolase n=1 Tax=Anaeromicrobium sediminis TaxID=1478221 RepID=A0A267MFK9_9FIRM|nr:enoyl-CoA hydratase/isomerase family protein [Anaeromicrobium sediminis]PAB58247.1 hypothetical protein CCE28_16560 [Anaeromicrobium sediminis]